MRLQKLLLCINLYQIIPIRKLYLQGGITFLWPTCVYYFFLCVRGLCGPDIFHCATRSLIIEAQICCTLILWRITSSIVCVVFAYLVVFSINITSEVYLTCEHNLLKVWVQHNESPLEYRSGCFSIFLTFLEQELFSDTCVTWDCVICTALMNALLTWFGP